MTVQRTLVTLADFRAEARAGRKPTDAIIVGRARVKVINQATRTIRWVLSDGTIDRAHDRIEQAGWELDAYKRNPVVLWAHNSWGPPIGAIAPSTLGVQNDQLLGDVEFAEREDYDFADTIFRLVAGGYIRAGSVGFMPIEYTFVEDSDRPWGMDFKRQELLEFSIVPVPCNGNALSEARSKGIDTRPLAEWAALALDHDAGMSQRALNHFCLSRRALEILHKAALEPASPRHRDGDGLAETDPAGGGAVVASCGRAKGEECGMKDPQECSIHREEDAKMLGRDISTLRKDIATLRAQLGNSSRSMRRETPESAAADADHGGAGDEMAECIRAAHAHVKSAGALYEAAAEYHEMAQGRLQKAVDHLDDPEAEEDGKKDADGDEDGDVEGHVRAAHAHMKSASDLYDQASEHRAKAEERLGKAIDHLDDPEREGGEKLAARKRARALARRHARETATA